MSENENEQRLTADAHKYILDKIQCQLCKGFGHPTEFCLKRIPTSHRLGLAHHIEKLLYVFLLEIDIQHIPSLDWNNLPQIFEIQHNVLQLEKLFFQKLNQFYLDRGIHQWRFIFEPNFFSKGRQTLGSQWA